MFCHNFVITKLYLVKYFKRKKNNLFENPGAALDTHQSFINKLTEELTLFLPPTLKRRSMQTVQFSSVRYTKKLYMYILSYVLKYGATLYSFNILGQFFSKFHLVGRNWMFSHPRAVGESILQEKVKCISSQQQKWILSLYNSTDFVLVSLSWIERPIW